ncbi:hypothetical protein [Nocardia australiensis]|nr:hypothetical protein [Nocardia australiensis]
MSATRGRRIGMQVDTCLFYTEVLGAVTTAVFDDTCGNLVQIASA